MANFKKLGFTLAEILIVIGILGIVAELTIPDLVSSYQKQIYLTSFKKAYSTINEALERIAADNSCPGDIACTGLFDATTDNNSAGQAFIKYFKVAKDCGTSNTETCWPAQTNYNFDGSSTDYDTFNNYGGYNFVTADGMAFSLFDYQSCQGSDRCGWIQVDINGPKKPNNSGSDTFFFEIHGNGNLLIPYGSQQSSWWWNDSDGNYCSKTNPDGYSCAGRIVEKSWTMDYLD